MQAVTRVNVEQASKGQVWKPTRPEYGEGRSCKSREAKRLLWFHRGNDDGMYRRKQRSTREAPRREG